MAKELKSTSAKGPRARSSQLGKCVMCVGQLSNFGGDAEGPTVLTLGMQTDEK